MFQLFGPRNAFLPTLPKVPTAGCVNSAVSSHGTHMSPAVPGQPERMLLGATCPYKPAGPTYCARSPPRLVLDRSWPDSTVKASPVTNVNKPHHCQPPRGH